MKRLLWVLLITLFVVYSLYFGDFFSTGFSPDSISGYRATTETGQQNVLLLLPGNEMILMKAFPEYDSYEGGLYHIVGTKGKRIYGNLWKLPSTLWGYRIYSEGATPWKMEYELKNAFKHNTRGSSFPRIGNTSRSVFLFFQNGNLEAGGHKYEPADFPEEWVSELRAEIE